MLQEMDIEWCRTLPYKEGHFGGWVSENFAAMTRILPWFYSDIVGLCPSPPWKPPRGVHHSRWTKAQISMWMRDRGIKGASKLNVSELKEKLGELMNRAGGPPPVLGPKGGPIHHVEDLIVSFYSVMSNLMTDTVDQCVVDIVDMVIKIFLSVLDQIDTSLREVGDDPIWITLSNCINLLNLPDILKKFGPLRYLWEGSMQGEGVIKHLRPFVRGMKNNWHVNALMSFCRHRSLLMMKHDNKCIGDWIL